MTWNSSCISSFSSKKKLKLPTWTARDSMRLEPLSIKVNLRWFGTCRSDSGDIAGIAGLSASEQGSKKDHKKLKEHGRVTCIPRDVIVVVSWAFFWVSHRTVHIRPLRHPLWSRCGGRARKKGLVTRQTDASRALICSKFKLSLISMIKKKKTYLYWGCSRDWVVVAVCK